MEQCNCCHKAYPIKKESHSQLNDHMQLPREYTCREQQQKKNSRSTRQKISGTAGEITMIGHLLFTYLTVKFFFPTFFF